MTSARLRPNRLTPRQHDLLQAAFGERLQPQVSLGRYTAARLGGPADYLLEVRSADELAETAARLWGLEIPFVVLGGGSNVLVSDAGLRGVVVLNHARQVQFEQTDAGASVWAESGANFGLIARQAAQRGLTGLEWAASIPGTVGGAVVGNAGAHGGDLSGHLILAEILQHNEVEPGAPTRDLWQVERFEYAYRTSWLKRHPEAAVVLSARLKLSAGDPAEIQSRTEALTEQRKRSQPPGASMGSMFKNPAGDYAGRLIEAAGLKGSRIGGAEISPVHANFFINRGQATASDLVGLIELARKTVWERFGIQLELEIELLGEWERES